MAKVFDDKGYEVQANRDAEVTKLHAKIGAVEEAADPHGRGRQFLAGYLGSPAGTRLGGFVHTAGGERYGARSPYGARVRAGEEAIGLIDLMG